MKFLVEYGESIDKRTLNYIVEDCSFDMEPFVKEYDFDLVLNKLSLSIINNSIVQLNGFCGLSKSMISNYDVLNIKKEY